jgi:carbon storage regulator
MLFITRKETQRIVIMNEIEVQIVKIDGDCVKIGIKAPRDISVHRYEVYERIKQTSASKRSITALPPDPTRKT